MRRSMKLRGLAQLLAGVAIVFFCSSCEEVPSYVEHPLAVFAPQPSGYWNGDGVPGSPKIVVHLSEQKAYFYKGKNLVGESTVSTGKPGFSTPPGHYHVVSKDRDHVSTVFGDYIDDTGNVVRSYIVFCIDIRLPGTYIDGSEMQFNMLLFLL